MLLKFIYTFAALSFIATLSFAGNSDQASQVSSSVWDYANDKVRGISLGGWLVLEPYITPSLFEQFGTDESVIPVDEYTFTKKLGKEAAKKQLEKHWDSFYTEADFRDIKTHGLNLVRIPIGYWAFKLLDDDPYVQGQEKYLDMAIQWAKTHDLKVWIDLHGVPGSQNGFDNSGKRGPIDWQKTQYNIDVSADVLDYIFKKYGSDNYLDTVIGIEVINEPMMPALNLDEALKFHYDRYYDYRVRYKSKNYFLVQEGFLPIGYWNQQFNSDFLNVSSQFSNLTAESQGKYFNGVVIDHHHYEVFTDGQLQKTNQARVQDIMNYAISIGDEQKFHPSLIGEWSGAITDCAKWLNGVGTGARYDGTYNVNQLNHATLSNWGDGDELRRVWGADGHEKTQLADNQGHQEGIEKNEAGSAEEEPEAAEYEYEEEQYDYHDDDNDVEIENYDEDQEYEEYLKRIKLVRRFEDLSSMSQKTCSNVRKYEDMSDSHRAAIRKFIEAQLIQYEKHSAGWIFWCYKTEGAIEWDFKLLVKHGLFPFPFNNYKYFNPDGSEIPLESKSVSSLSVISSSYLFGLSLFLSATIVLF